MTTILVQQFLINSPISNKGDNMIKDVSLQLLAGTPIDLGVCKAHSLKLKEITEMGENKYNQYLSLILFDKNNLEIEENIDATTFELVVAYCVYDQNFRNMFLESLELFTKEKAKLNKKGVLYFGSLKDNRFLNDEVFNDLQQVIKLQNNIKEEQEEEIKPGNERAKKFMEEMKKKKDRLAQVKKKDISLASIISGVAWKSNNTNIKDIWDLTVYQLYDAFYRLESIDYYNSILTGIYSGTVDGKKINLNKINWAKVLKH